MSRKKRKFESNLHPLDKYLGKMKLKDIKRECVIRGMVFDDVVSKSIPDLCNWLRANFYNASDHNLLNIFDDWQEAQVLAFDPNSVIHSTLRLGYIAERDEDGNTTKRKRAKVIVAKKKIKRERTGEGLFTGTKKAYTFQLQKEGLNKTEVVTMVIDKFPEASEKSISIWYNKSRKLNGKK
jgi:hypothetical protein